jgi:hypothetical protein
MTMATLASRASGKRQARKFSELGNARRTLNFKRNGKQKIADKIMRRLGSLNLPPDPFVYEAVLEKLEREVT